MANRLLLVSLFLGTLAFADGGPGHTHALEEGNANMQALGVFVILVLACAGFYFLSKKK